MKRTPLSAADVADMQRGLEDGSPGVRVLAHKPDGSSEDITEGVQALYDLVTSSMDWGSGFWTYEDAVPVADLAEACGFPGAEGTRKYVEAQRFSEEQARFLKERHLTMWDEPCYHDHVWSTNGRCMWPRCEETR